MKQQKNTLFLQSKSSAAVSATQLSNSSSAHPKSQNVNINHLAGGLQQLLLYYAAKLLTLALI